MRKLEPWSKLPNPDEFMQRATRTGVLGECTIVRCRTGQKNCQCSNLGCQQNLKSPVAHWQEHVFSPIETLQCDGNKIFKVFKFCQFWLTFPKMLLAWQKIGWMETIIAVCGEKDCNKKLAFWFSSDHLLSWSSQPWVSLYSLASLAPQMTSAGNSIRFWKETCVNQCEGKLRSVCFRRRF